MRDMRDLVHTFVVSVEAPWVPDMSRFSVRLMLIRHELGWNAKEAALACGLPAQSCAVMLAAGGH